MLTTSFAFATVYVHAPVNYPHSLRSNQPSTQNSPLHPPLPAPNPSIQHKLSPSSTTTSSTLVAAATCTAPTSIHSHSKLSNSSALSPTLSIIHNCLIAAIMSRIALFSITPLYYTYTISHSLQCSFSRDHFTRSLTPDAIEYHLALA